MQIFADNTHHEAERNDAYYLFFVRLCVKTSMFFVKIDLLFLVYV